jgi:hypothetical protein
VAFHKCTQLKFPQSENSILEFVVSNITGNNQWENGILLDFYFHALSGQQNQLNLEPHD